MSDKQADIPGRPARVRPAVYGRNYSYFSHRVFVAFMPEDLHKYLQDRLSLVGTGGTSLPAGGATHLDSEAIDMQLVRWVLLHRSQLNALALNREVEAWRGPNDVLLLPQQGRLRSDQAYRLDITLQFAIELELASALESDLLENRPRLMVALLDAAYFVSRQRSEQDRLLGDAADEHDADIDLSETGRAAFEAYLVQRMNLDEDKSDEAIEQARVGAPAHVDAARGPLSVKEVNWLHGVAIGVARTLSSAAGAAELQSRWMKVLAARWAARGLSVPDSSLFEALLSGAESPLVALPALGVDVPAGAQPDASESYRYQWRASQFSGAPWAQSLIGIAHQSAPVCDFIEQVDALLRHAMEGPEPVARAGAETDSQPLRLLSDRYRVLPTTPAWASVSEAISRMRLARKGLGNTAVLFRDGQLLAQYADMLKSSDAADAVALMLQGGAMLAGMQAGVRQPAPSQGARPQPADWTVALTALLDGLRLDSIDVGSAALRLREMVGQLVTLGPAMAAAFPPRPPALPGASDGAWTSEMYLHAWPSVAQLDEAVVQGFEDGRQLGQARSGEPWFVGLAWVGLEQRLMWLTQDQDGMQPASASELACVMLGVGPAPALPLRLSDAGARLWTDILLNAVVGSRARGERAFAKPVPLVLAAYALERLGARALRHEAQQSLLRGLALAEQARDEIRAYADQRGLWDGEGLSARIAVVLGPWQESMAEEWPLPPSGGLILAATEANLHLLREAGLPEVMQEMTEPLRVAFEPWTSRPGELAPLEAWVRQLPMSRSVIRLWLYREGRIGPESPQLVDPDSADELWNWGPALDPTA